MTVRNLIVLPNGNIVRFLVVIWIGLPRRVGSQSILKGVLVLLRYGIGRNPLS
jgi:hypothetical protein